MGGDLGQTMKVALPLAATAAAIYFTGGAAAPAVAPDGLAAGQAAGISPDVMAGTDLAMGGSGAIGVGPYTGLEMPPAAKGFDWDKGLNRGVMGMMIGNTASNAMGLNQPPPPPFQMGSAQAPSPVVGTSGGFVPTAKGAADRLAQQMAARKQQVPRFA